MTVTLLYTLTSGILIPGTLIPKVAAVLLPEVMLDLGLQVTMDNTIFDGTHVTRTIVLTVLPLGAQNFPTADDLIAATTNLYTNTLRIGTPGSFTAAVPVVV